MNKFFRIIGRMFQLVGKIIGALLVAIWKVLLWCKKHYKITFWALVLLGGLLAYAYMNAVEFLWFSSLNYQGYFIRKELYRFGLFAGAGGIFFIIFFLNFWVESRFLGATGEPDAGEADVKKAYHDMAALFRRGSMRIYFHVSYILAIIASFPLFQKSQDVLQFLFGSDIGAWIYGQSGSIPEISIPEGASVFGKSISFYLFSLPLQQMIKNGLLLVFSLLFVALILLYWIEHRSLSINKEERLGLGAKVHMLLLFFFIVLMVAWGYNLDRYELMLSTNHEPLFFGPGWLEMEFDYPLLVAAIILIPLSAIALLCMIFFRQRLNKAGWIGLLAVPIVCVLVLSLRNYSGIRDMLYKFVVKPNEAAREEPYINNAILMTMASYRLDQVEKRDFIPSRATDLAGSPQVVKILSNIPVWDGELLDDVYTENQSIYKYYSFPDVDIDRYTIQGIYQQVYLAARELNINGLDPADRKWENIHLKYTHGHGAVMTPAVQAGEKPMTWYLRDLSLKSDVGIRFDPPGIYYGTESYEYVIAPNEAGEIGQDITGDGDEEKKINYQGTGGVLLSKAVEERPADVKWYHLGWQLRALGRQIRSLAMETLFSIHFNDWGILLNERHYGMFRKNKEDRRILFHRNIVERVGNITPFLVLDPDPYLIITEKGLFWLIDAYTVSHRFPNAKPFDGRNNYIRNSVKIVVDAYNGSVNYYVADASDPIISIYRLIYPNLFAKDITDMPADIRSHVRYPKKMFEAQMRVYASYHQTEPLKFFTQKDKWDFAGIEHGEIAKSKKNTDVPQSTPPKESKQPGSNDQSQATQADGAKPNDKKISEEKAPPTDAVSHKSYYSMLNLIQPDVHEFMLLCPMSPKGRANLRALAVAGCDAQNYGKIIVFLFPPKQQIPGPSQINARIKQDTDISAKLTLWDSVGSSVVRGKILVLPMNNFILYVQPLYMKTEVGRNIPELKRIIVSQGDLVAMDVTIEGAYNKLIEKMKLRDGEQVQPVDQPDSSEVTESKGETVSGGQSVETSSEAQQPETTEDASGPKPETPQPTSEPIPPDQPDMAKPESDVQTHQPAVESETSGNSATDKPGKEDVSAQPAEESTKSREPAPVASDVTSEQSQAESQPETGQEPAETHSAPQDEQVQKTPDSATEVGSHHSASETAKSSDIKNGAEVSESDQNQ